MSDLALPAPSGTADQPRRWQRGVTRLARHALAILAVAVIVLVVLWALAPALFTSADPYQGIPRQRFQPPSADHWFGTDAIGRDLFGRVVYGASTSLRAVAIAILVAFVNGAVLGMIAGFVGGTVEDVLMRIVDILLSIPSLLVSLILITVLGVGTTNVAIAVGIAAVAAFARVMRAEVLRVRTALYVEAAAAGGVRWTGILWRHVLPNAIGPVIALSVLEFGTAILAISGLSFLGFGPAPPTPEWGALIADGRSYVATAWWLTALPGGVILLVVLSANIVSRSLDRHRGATEW